MAVRQLCHGFACCWYPFLLHAVCDAMAQLLQCSCGCCNWNLLVSCYSPTGSPRSAAHLVWRWCWAACKDHFYTSCSFWGCTRWHTPTLYNRQQCMQHELSGHSCLTAMISIVYLHLIVYLQIIHLFLRRSRPTCLASRSVAGAQHGCIALCCISSTCCLMLCRNLGMLRQ